MARVLEFSRDADWVRSTPLSVPSEVAEAVRAEAVRRHGRPGDVLTDFVRRWWPRYVAEQLHGDLKQAAPSQVIDADVVSSRTLHAEMPPALAEGTPNPKAPQPQVTQSIPPGDLTDEDASGGSAT
jgi:hypothetical protein